MRENGCARQNLNGAVPPCYLLRRKLLFTGVSLAHTAELAEWRYWVICTSGSAAAVALLAGGADKGSV
jgi:hypothetical protein